MVAVVAGCGTALPNSAFGTGGQVLTGGGSGTGGGAGGSGTNVGSGDSGTGPATGDAGSAGPTAAGGGSNATGSAAGSTGSGSSSAAGSQGAGSQGAAAQGAKGTGGASSGASGGATAAGGGGGPNTASDVGVTATSIRIGNVTGQSGALGPDAFGVTARGLKVFVASINARGGINGRKVDLQTCDDGQDGSQNIACTQQLVGQKKVFALVANNSLSSSGSAHYEFTQGVPDLGFPLNNGYYKYPNMFSIEGTPYPRDGKQAGFNGTADQNTGTYRWFKQQRHVDRAAFFFYSEASSAQEGHLQSQGSKAEGISDVYEPSGGQGENLAAPNFDSDVLAMKGKGANAPQAIFDAIDVNGNQKLCASMDRYNFNVIAKVSTIEVWNQSLGTPAWSQHCRNEVYVTGGSASYADSANPAVAGYLKDYNAYGGGALQSQWTLEGYATGQMFTDGVAQLGGNVTRKGFISWLDGLDKYTDHGFFSPREYKVVPPSQMVQDCNIFAQWQDQAGTFVTRAPLDTCYPVTPVTSPLSPDGS